MPNQVQVSVYIENCCDINSRLCCDIHVCFYFPPLPESSSDTFCWCSRPLTRRSDNLSRKRARSPGHRVLTWEMLERNLNKHNNLTSTVVGTWYWVQVLSTFNILWCTNLIGNAQLLRKHCDRSNILTLAQ